MAGLWDRAGFFRSPRKLRAGRRSGISGLRLPFPPRASGPGGVSPDGRPDHSASLEALNQPLSNLGRLQQSDEGDGPHGPLGEPVGGGLVETSPFAQRRWRGWRPRQSSQSASSHVGRWLSLDPQTHSSILHAPPLPLEPQRPRGRRPLRIPEVFRQLLDRGVAQGALVVEPNGLDERPEELASHRGRA